MPISTRAATLKQEMGTALNKELESLTYAVYRPDKPLLTLTIYRNESYIKRLRKKEKEFVQELVDRGHSVQYQFVGRLVK